LPLVTGDRLVGFVGFGPKTGGDLYSQEDLANLRSLGLQVASLLESRRLYQESLTRKQLETELAVARKIQAQLLPTEALKHASALLCGRTEPSQAVGGDYFDYFESAPGQIGFCIADVAGKGIPAALLMSTVRVSFRTEAMAGREPEMVIDRLNRAVSEILAPGQFVCLFYGIYVPETRLLSYCNAGMDPPLLLRRDGVLERLKKGGPVLGILTDHTYRRGTVRLHPRDLLVLYTDGITDERSPDGEFYDEERLIATLCRDGSPAPSDVPLDDLLHAVFASVSAFGGDDRTDDRTVMLLRCL
jgi:sigma-B regulation protein RsbU (phosphoserine phosphatase)